MTISFRFVFSVSTHYLVMFGDKMSSCGMEGDTEYKHGASFCPPSWTRESRCVTSGRPVWCLQLLAIALRGSGLVLIPKARWWVNKGGQSQADDVNSRVLFSSLFSYCSFLFLQCSFNIYTARVDFYMQLRSGERIGVCFWLTHGWNIQGRIPRSKTTFR